jgi:hypothetical protein
MEENSDPFLPAHSLESNIVSGHQAAQAVSRQLPTAVARVRSHVRSCGIYGGQSSTACRIFPRTSVSPANSHSTKCSIFIIRGWYSTPNSGPHTKWTQAHPHPKKTKKLVAGFPTLQPGFDPRSGHMWFVLDEVALWQVFSEHFSFPCRFSFHRLLHIN